MSEMIERVARAIAKSIERDFAPDEIDPEHWRVHVDEARAAIAAMREPTDAMEEAGIRAPEAVRPSCDHEVIVNPRRIWQAMVDEALR